jgi:hypothetical protein
LTTAQAVAFAVGVACIGLVFAYLLFGIAYIFAMGRDSGIILQRVRTVGWAVLQDQLPGQR